MSGDGPLLLGVGWFPDTTGGLDRYLRDLLLALAADGGPPPRAVVLGPASDPPRGVEVAGPIDGSLPRRLASYTAAARRAARLSGVVDAHFVLYAAIPVLARGLAGRPTVTHFHGPWADESLAVGQAGVKVALKRALERRVHRRADEVIVISQAFRRLLVERYRVPPWRVSVIAPGVDLERFTRGDRAAARRRLGVDEDRWLAVSVRRLVPRMGLDVLVDAWGALAGGGAGPLLAIAGDGPERRPLEERARALGVDESVRLLGRVSDEELVDWYRAADVCVVPTLALEGFGLVVLEALACGTPVLATDVGGLPEALAGLGAGLVLPAGDAPALASRIDGAMRGTLPLPAAARCRAHAEGFTWKASAARHREVYSSVARRAGRRRPRRPRVVWVDHCARLSGAQLAMARLIPALRSVDSHVILAEEGPLVRRLMEAGVSVEVLPMREAARGVTLDRLTPRRLPAASVGHSAAYAARLAARLRRLDPDLVHTNSMKAAIYGAAAARLARIPVVWHLHDRIAPEYMPAPAVRGVRAAARLLPDALIANSRATLATVDPRAPAVVIPCATDLDVPLADAGSDAGDPLLGMVGRMVPWKGQPVFLRAFARAFPHGGARALIVGGALFGEEEYQRELHDLAERLGVADRVEFAGFRDDVPALMATMDVLVHASVIPEPFGQVIVEGMAAGLPVVAVDAGGPSEIVEDGVEGLLYPASDVDALARALRRLADDPAARAEMGRAGRRAARRFAPERIAAEVTAVYRGLLEGDPLLPRSTTGPGPADGPAPPRLALNGDREGTPYARRTGLA